MEVVYLVCNESIYLIKYSKNSNMWNIITIKITLFYFNIF